MPPTAHPAGQRMKTPARSAKVGLRWKTGSVSVLKTERKSVRMESASPARCQAASPARQESRRAVLCVERT